MSDSTTFPDSAAKWPVSIRLRGVSGLPILPLTWPIRCSGTEPTHPFTSFASVLLPTYARGGDDNRHRRGGRWTRYRASPCGSNLEATIDTGFTGDLDLPYALGPNVNARFFGRGRANLAGGQSIKEEYYLVDFPCDGNTVRAVASFVHGAEILIGTRLLCDYRLELDFLTRRVHLDRSI